MDLSSSLVVIVAGLIGLVFIMLLWFVSRYKRCPSDKILVIYGKTGTGQSSKCLAGGAAFIWPVIQDYQYMDLTPISIDVDLRGALSRQNIRVSVPSRFTVAVSNEPGIMEVASERLLGKSTDEIRETAKDIIFGQLRLVVATMDIEEINSDRDKFLTNVSSNVGSELKKIGLTLINVNVTDIQDESGYIEALGKEAAAKAINDAKQSVAEKNRDGSIGEANANKEKRVSVSAADAIAKVGEATAEANAIDGENEAKVRMAISNAERRLKEAEALRKATAAEKIQAANSLQEAYLAEKNAELARADRERASREADVIVQAEIAKRRIEIDAEAEAERTRLVARGLADAVFMQKEAEAKGLYEVLQKQADGFDEIVKAVGGNPRDAVLMLIADKLPELVKTQVDAIKNIKIDKVTVWEGGNQEGSGNNTSKFISSMYKSVPPLNELFNMAGMELPTYLGKVKPEEAIEEKEPKE
ncbi:MAG: flotillin family protein [Saprospiraceae bacterium]|nr:flotillin family protein [Candidatus Opimibacter skivensis]MBL0008322.1 flotillin family protein [Candidatus Opimibacter skivensis]HQW26451.1 SPFH domain-containing protein [Saprospiraceae bacterium]